MEMVLSWPWPSPGPHHSPPSFNAYPIQPTPTPRPISLPYKFPATPSSSPSPQISLFFFVAAGASCCSSRVIICSLPRALMGRSHLPIFLLIQLLFSVGHAALTFHDIFNLVLPNSPSTEEVVPRHLPHGEVTPLAAAGETGDRGPGDVSDHSKAQVDFGTKAWPFVYYSRRDRLGTVDWGTKSWPYIYYSERDDRDDLGTKPSDDATIHHGRKTGHGFRV